MGTPVNIFIFEYKGVEFSVLGQTPAEAELIFKP